VAELVAPAFNALRQQEVGIMNTIDPDNLIRFREQLNVAGEYLCGLTRDAKAREAYIAVLYVQSSLKLDADEMKLAAQQELNPWAHVPQQYAGRWGFDYDEKRREFFVHCNGHGILHAEDSEVCDAICRAYNATLTSC
jgi:hypothetical protein